MRALIIGDMTVGMSLSDRQGKWLGLLATVVLISALVSVYVVPSGDAWRWVNFAVDLVTLAASFTIAAVVSPHRWVHVGLVIVWVALALFIWPRPL
ncbi:hypothetical protein [Deinococcus soli (ex Cha et al. 2016)]|nr:hypothetical protein [Deinococcus soli (ex Cha et al. 2016)]